MSNVLHRLLSKLNFTAKDKAEFIKELKSSGGGELENRVNNIEQILSDITDVDLINVASATYSTRVYTFTDDLENNLEIINLLGVTDNYNVKYKLSDTNILNCIYYNGTLTCIKDGNITQYDVNFNTGEITRRCIIYTELIGYEVRLDVCTSGSTEADRNLEILNKAYFALGDHFVVNIDAGVGVGKYIPDQGGRGHITTADGVNVYYTIGEDGSVVKEKEIDLEEIYNLYLALK